MTRSSLEQSELVLNATLDEAITLLAPQLRSSKLGALAATQLLERLRLGLEDAAGTRKLLRALRRLLPPPPHPTVGEQLLEMLPSLEHQVPVVEELAALIAPGDERSLGEPPPSPVHNSAKLPVSLRSS